MASGVGMVCASARVGKAGGGFGGWCVVWWAMDRWSDDGGVCGTAFVALGSVDGASVDGTLSFALFFASSPSLMGAILYIGILLK